VTISDGRRPAAVQFWLERENSREGLIFRAAKAMKSGLADQNPLLTGVILGEGVTLPESSYSIVRMSNPDVLL